MNILLKKEFAKVIVNALSNSIMEMRNALTEKLGDRGILLIVVTDEILQLLTEYVESI